jgi:hypothetical protein
MYSMQSLSGLGVLSIVAEAGCGYVGRVVSFLGMSLEASTSAASVVAGDDRLCEASLFEHAARSTTRAQKSQRLEPVVRD